MDKVFKNGGLRVHVYGYPVDGVQVNVSTWDGDDYVTVYDTRVIADSLYEAVTGALCAAGVEWEQADYLVTSWGILAPVDEEEGVYA